MAGEAFARSASTPIDREVQGALPMLEACFRSAARAMRARLVTRTGKDLPVTVAEVRSASALEVMDGEAAAGNAVWCPFHFGRADLSGFMVMEGRLLSRLVGRLFGDGDVVLGTAESDRALSEVELSVGGRLCRELFDSLERYWPPPHPPRFFAGELSMARHGISDIPATTPMVVAVIRFGPEDNPLGVMECAVPGALAKGLSGKKQQAASRPEASRVLNFDRLMPVEVDLVVELARIELSLHVLENLQVGGDIPLGQLHEICARVNSSASFFGEAGTTGGMRSFKIGRRVGTASTSAPKDR